MEEKLKAARLGLDKWSAQRAETQARLEELRSRLENLQARLEQAGKTIELAEAHVKEAGEKFERARQAREAAEDDWHQAVTNESSKRNIVVDLENQRRARSDERAQRLAEHTRLKAQLEVLEQADQSLAGYAEGARFLLDAARQSRLQGARGALSASLDVPVELEQAVAAALGDTLDAILLEADEVDTALQLLESENAGRAVLLPLDGQHRQNLSRPGDDAFLGVASELVKAPDELRAAVNLILGQTLIVRDRAAARRLIRELPAHARIVTLRGEVFRGDGLIIAGKSASQAASALSRPRQKRELGEALAASETQIRSLNGEVDTLSSRINEAQHELAQAGEAVQASRLKLEQAQESERQAGLESESARRQQEWQQSQYAQLKAEADEAASVRGQSDPIPGGPGDSICPGAGTGPHAFRAAGWHGSGGSPVAGLLLGNPSGGCGACPGGRPPEAGGTEQGGGTFRYPPL